MRRGSPPQVRGKLYTAVTPCTCARITPAGAGKTSVAIGTGVCNRDHPRRCGENSACTGFCTAFVGSPPQVRGKPWERENSIAYNRITPAGAGKTRRWAASRVSLRDHPRRCGENRFVYRLVVHSSGSPPQVRGKRKLLPELSDCVGITPAGAGKTFL